MSDDAKLNALYRAIEKAREAQLVVGNPAFDAVFAAFEDVLINRALALDIGAEADVSRSRLLQAVSICRAIKRTFANDAASMAELEKELDAIEGRRLRRIA